MVFEWVVLGPRKRSPGRMKAPLVVGQLGWISPYSAHWSASLACAIRSESMPGVTALRSI